MTNLSRRSLITGLISFMAAPAIVRAASLMPVKAIQHLSEQSILDSMLEANRNCFWISHQGFWHLTMDSAGLRLKKIDASEIFHLPTTEEKE